MAKLVCLGSKGLQDLLALVFGSALLWVSLGPLAQLLPLPWSVPCPVAPPAGPPLVLVIKLLREERMLSQACWVYEAFLSGRLS
jgi:hypothetical protein